MNWVKKLNNQRGAMFSMDARIALIVGSVLAGTIATLGTSRIERVKVENTESYALTLIDGLESYYKSVGITTIPTTLAAFRTDIIDSGIVDEAEMATDAWGQDWVYDTCTVNNTVIEGVTVPTIHYAVLYSPGKNGTTDSGTGDFITNGSCQADFGAWTPSSDDIGAKFTSITIERARVERYQKQVQGILDALIAYESAQYLTNQEACEASGSPQAQTSAPAPYCNVDGNGTYDPSEEGRLNYYPRSQGDGTGTYFDNTNYAATAAGVANLIALLNLPTQYERDPWNRLLSYNSNVSGRQYAPFTVSVEY